MEEVMPSHIAPAAARTKLTPEPGSIASTVAAHRWPVADGRAQGSGTYPPFRYATAGQHRTGVSGAITADQARPWLHG